MRRRGQEIRYAHLVVAELRSFRPDIMIASNNPLDAQKRIQDFCLRARIPFVFWLQDIYSNAIKSILGAKFPVAGISSACSTSIWRNRCCAGPRASSPSPMISCQARRMGRRGGQDRRDRELGPEGQDHDRRARQRLARGAGPWRQQARSLHGNARPEAYPDLILAAARTFASAGEAVKIVVASEGPQIEYLRKTALAEGLEDLILLPFQPFEKYADVLAAADVLIAMIEPDAAAYSVPSKILSYHCSGRAIVLSAAKANLAAKIIAKTGSGIVAAPADSAGFVAAIRTLLDDDARRLACGDRARAYADETFDLVKIGGRFETLLANCLAEKGQSLTKILRAEADIG